MKQLLSLLALSLCCFVSATAKVELPSLVADNMVLEQQSDVRLWGKAAPKASVKITPSWDGNTVTCTAGNDGRWETTVHTPRGGFEAYTLTFDDGEPTTIHNVLIGEVWLASGQSNMEQTLYGYEQCPVENAEDEIINASHERGIRMFNVPNVRKDEPQEECGGRWVLPDMDTAPAFSATAWFFAKSLTRARNVPVGMVVAAAGGSMIESWMSKETVEKYPDIPTDKAGIEKISPWLRPIGLYNAMFYPIRHYTYKGIIWYQGCSNVNHHATYAQRMADLVSLWRHDLNLGELPFYYVELAPFAHDGTAEGINGALLREAQFKAQSLISNSAMISTNDLVQPYELHNVHPRGKDKVGKRLSYAALKLTYGQDILQYTGPIYDKLTLKGHEAMVSFKNIPMGLCRTIGLKGFEVAGADKVFYPADSIQADKRKGTVTVSSEKVPTPVAVRYCFHNFQIGNLIGAYELPAVPFRTDNW